MIEILSWIQPNLFRIVVGILFMIIVGSQFLPTLKGLGILETII